MAKMRVLHTGYLIAVQPAPAPYLASPEGRAALRIVLVPICAVPRVRRSCEHVPGGFDKHLLPRRFPLERRSPPRRAGQARNPHPATRSPKPKNMNPKTQTPTLNPQLQTLDPNPQTLNTEPRRAGSPCAEMWECAPPADPMSSATLAWRASSRTLAVFVQVRPLRE